MERSGDRNSDLYCVPKMDNIRDLGCTTDEGAGRFKRRFHETEYLSQAFVSRGSRSKQLISISNPSRQFCWDCVLTAVIRHIDVYHLISMYTLWNLVIDLEAMKLWSIICSFKNKGRVMVSGLSSLRTQHVSDYCPNWMGTLAPFLKLKPVSQSKSWMFSTMGL